MNNLTIIAFGDSITEGSAINGQFKNWVELVSEALGAELINAGRGGQTSSDGLARIERDVTSKSPDYVIVEFGMNDHVLVAEGKFKVAPDLFESNLNEIITRCQSVGAKCLLVTPNRIIEGNKSEYYYSRHDEKLYTEYGGAQRLIERYAELVRSVARERDCGLIDLNRISADYPPHEFLRSLENCGHSDGVHPAELGARVIADEIVKYFNEVICNEKI